jgi:hypothetical protein
MSQYSRNTLIAGITLVLPFCIIYRIARIFQWARPKGKGQFVFGILNNILQETAAVLMVTYQLRSTKLNMDYMGRKLNIGFCVREQY